jgi:hypothetical protein
MELIEASIEQAVDFSLNGVLGYEIKNRKEERADPPPRSISFSLSNFVLRT